MARKILLADDSVTAQNMGRKILADAGYEVLTVNNGSAALKKIAEAKPELIVLDVYMPGYSGLEVCQRLKEAQETSRIPVLLTVGKLEPFKPEEAKRVRADGYIVKPFEASELLSALAKLEDKIVPRQELSKPGRFARANAALDSYDKTVAAEEDSGWKNRIGFPSKKKKGAEEETTDDSAIYNAVNKDLRTVAEPKSAQRQDAKPPETPEEPKVNLAALAPEGLPKDVTAEEIAALAAAAAQVQGKVAETKLAEIAAEPAKPEAALEAKAEVTPESRDVQAIVEMPKPLEAQPATATPASAEKDRDEKKDAGSVPVPSSADVNAAIAALEAKAEPEAEKPSPKSDAHGSHEGANEPATMAVAAGAEYAATTSRWTAVPVALAPDEVGLSLALEMQKAHAAFAAAEFSHGASLAATPAPAVAEAIAFEKVSTAIHPVSTEIHSAPSTEASQPKDEAVFEPVASASVAPAVPEVVPEAVPETVPELAQAASSIGHAATDFVTAAVHELEAVAAAFESARPQEAAQEPVPTPSAEVQSIDVQSIEAQSVDAQSIEAQRSEVQHIEGSPVVAETGTPEAPKADEVVASERNFETAKEDAKYEERREEAQQHETPVPAADLAAEAAQALSSIIPQETSGTSLPAEPATAGHVELPKEVGKKESEMAESTEAAWASWRRIRESGDGKSTPSSKNDSRDEAAMAVAAGAEKSPEEVAASTNEDSGEISSIVDSVLADLRPQIVAEISRKLGKKK